MKIKTYICPACGRPQDGWTRRLRGAGLKPTCKYCGFIITGSIHQTTFTKVEFIQYMKELISKYKKDDPSQQSLF